MEKVRFRIFHSFVDVFSFLCLVEHYSCEYGTMRYYIYCALSGMLSCGITHTAVVPLVCFSSVENNRKTSSVFRLFLGFNQMSFASQTSEICESHAGFSNHHCVCFHCSTFLSKKIDQFHF